MCKRGIPVSKDIVVVSFLVDLGAICDWNLQGLTTDSTDSLSLSPQNGILVTQSTRYPLLREAAAVVKLLQNVLQEVNDNTKSLLNLDTQFLNRFSSNTGKATFTTMSYCLKF